MPKDNRIGLMTLSAELYHYLCDNSFERALKSTNPEDRREFRQRIREFELAFRNTSWELENPNG